LWERQLIARAEVDAARANLTVAEGRSQDAIEEVHNRQAMLAQRRAELAIARQQLADTVIVSPLDGAVTQKQASVGEYVAAGAPVVTLVRLHPLRLQLLVPEREAAAMRIGQTVRLTVEGDANPYSGRVARLSPIIARDEHGLLRPGSFAKADIVVEADQKIITVPAGAIVTFAGIEKVLSVADGKIIETRVRTGRRVDDEVEITEGVAVGAVVVVEPGTLVGGQPVTVIN
jgi:RND family efflux transporter MFP subunit